MKTRIDITADEIIQELGSALKQFGTYTFWDKGVYESVDLDSITPRLQKLTAPDAAEIIRAVSKSSEHGKGTGERLAPAIVVCLEGWDELFDEPDMEKLL